MKKKIFTVIGIVIFIFIVYFIGSGFVRNTSVFINDYTVSANGKEITLNVGVSSSVGYVRDVKVQKQQGGKLYLDFYSAFGGLNGSVGAKNTFTLSLDEDTSIIAIYRNSNCYEEVLSKTLSGTWERSK